MHSNPYLVSLEGISGVGKTYLVSQLRRCLPVDRLTLIREASNRVALQRDTLILAALSSGSDAFFRGGNPGSETFLLLALKLYDYEQIIAGSLASNKIVIEDRSIDSIAVYQAAILHPHDESLRLASANDIYALASRWRPPPQVTFLIEDDFDVAISRAENRNARRFTSNELALLRTVADLYAVFSTQHPSRFVRLDRRQMSEGQVLQTMLERITS